tara:strand:+ start:59 stop:535 length:477 start_codon:yes stop_codon:yes gene_type:complete
MEKKGGAGVVILVMVIIIGLGVGGYFMFFQSSLENCKEDRHCTVSAIRNCHEAKGNVVTDGAGNPSRETYIEVRGMNGERCEVYIKNQDDKEMVCQASYELYGGMDYGGYNTLIQVNDIIVSALDYCNGDLKDHLESEYIKLSELESNTDRDKIALSY